MLRLHFKSMGQHRIFEVDQPFEEFDNEVMKETLIELGYPVDGALMVEVK